MSLSKTDFEKWQKHIKHLASQEYEPYTFLGAKDKKSVKREKEENEEAGEGELDFEESGSDKDRTESGGEQDYLEHLVAAKDGRKDKTKEDSEEHTEEVREILEEIEEKEKKARWKSEDRSPLA